MSRAWEGSLEDRTVGGVCGNLGDEVSSGGQGRWLMTPRQSLPARRLAPVLHRAHAGVPQNPKSQNRLRRHRRRLAGGGMAAYQLGIVGPLSWSSRPGAAMTRRPKRRCSTSRQGRCGAGSKEKPFGFYDATVDGGWKSPASRNTTALARLHVVARPHTGGRTEPPGRIRPHGEYDFAEVARWPGADWPISYADLAPVP